MPSARLTCKPSSLGAFVAWRLVPLLVAEAFAEHGDVEAREEGGGRVGEASLNGSEDRGDSGYAHGRRGGRDDADPADGFEREARRQEVARE